MGSAQAGISEVVGPFGPTLDHRMIETGGRSTGFDYLRITLACSVIAWHSFGTSYGLPFAFGVERTPIRPIIAVILPAFFALSGFLVAASLYRSPTISTFLGLRALRIVPALAVEVTLSALILGPLLTTTSWAAYFTSPVLYGYFLNIVGDIHYTLPGLFLRNPIPNNVNGQLWTVPWELRCYIALAALSIVGLVKKRELFLGVVVVATLATFGHRLHGGRWSVDVAHGVAPVSLLLAFLTAVAIYNYKDVIPWNGPLCWACVALLVILFLVPYGDYFAAFPIAYATIYVGLLNPKKLPILRGADYSYGLYLYGLVIQQAVEQIGPWAHQWYINLPISLMLASVVAAFSWHVVEKPALRLRAALPKIERYFAKLWPARSQAS